jgi:hypothetical protein
VAYSCEADLVAKVVEASDAVLGVLKIVVFDETETDAVLVSRLEVEEQADIPLAQLRLHIDDGLGALNVTEALTPVLEHLIRGLWEQASNVHVGLAGLVLEATVERLMRRARGRDGPRNGRFLVYQSEKMR